MPPLLMRKSTRTGGKGDSPLTRKRAASPDAAEDLPPPAPNRVCRPRLILADDSSDSDAESEDFERVPRRNLRVKPPAQRYESEDPLGHSCEVFNVLNGRMPFNLQPTTRSPHQPNIGRGVSTRRAGGEWDCITPHTSRDREGCRGCVIPPGSFGAEHRRWG